MSFHSPVLSQLFEQPYPINRASRARNRHDNSSSHSLGSVLLLLQNTMGDGEVAEIALTMPPVTGLIRKWNLLTLDRFG